MPFCIPGIHRLQSLSMIFFEVVMCWTKSTLINIYFQNKSTAYFFSNFLHLTHFRQPLCRSSSIIFEVILYTCFFFFWSFYVFLFFFLHHNFLSPFFDTENNTRFFRGNSWAFNAQCLIIFYERKLFYPKTSMTIFC